MSKKRWDPNPKGTMFIKKSSPRVPSKPTDYMLAN